MLYNAIWYHKHCYSATSTGPKICRGEQPSDLQTSSHPRNVMRLLADSIYLLGTAMLAGYLLIFMSEDFRAVFKNIIFNSFVTGLEKSENAI